MILPINQGVLPLEAYREALRGKASSGGSERLILAVNEIVANIMRYADPAATMIAVSITQECCIIKDNGSAFSDFSAIWQQVKNYSGKMIDHPYLGLSIVQHLYPEAFYLPRSGNEACNQFVLPFIARHKDLPPFVFHG